MVKHIMADGTERDSIRGCVVPKELSESILSIFVKRGDNSNGNHNKTRTIVKK